MKPPALNEVDLGEPYAETPGGKVRLTLADLSPLLHAYTGLSTFLGIYAVFSVATPLYVFDSLDPASAHQTLFYVLTIFFALIAWHAHQARLQEHNTAARAYGLERARAHLSNRIPAAFACVLVAWAIVMVLSGYEVKVGRLHLWFVVASSLLNCSAALLAILLVYRASKKVSLDDSSTRI